MAWGSLTQIKDLPVSVPLQIREHFINLDSFEDDFSMRPYAG